MKINKLSLVAVLAVGSLLTCTTLAKAQDTNNVGKRRAPSVEQRVDRLSTELSLNAEQKTKVTALLQEDNKKMSELRADTSLSRDDRRAKIRAIGEERDTKMKAILTPEQFEKYQKSREEMRSRRGGQGGSDTGKKAE
jgi:Spy/CpxP family protein refolding chaperone